MKNRWGRHKSVLREYNTVKGTGGAICTKQFRFSILINGWNRDIMAGSLI
ncbi:hypothetical protein DXA34_23130 [[Clostridium] symbiosum]|nr:hypothetical protein DXA34_23130 [[Clostridium] symbiosum]